MPLFALMAYGGYVISQHFTLPQALDISLIATLFMWSGTVLRETGYIESKSVGLIVLIMSVFFWIYCIQNGYKLDMGSRIYSNFSLVVAEAIAGGIAIIILSKGIEQLKVTKCLKFLGKNTLLLMCIHQLDLYQDGWQMMITSSWVAALVRLFADIFILFVLLGIKEIFNRLRTQNNN